MKKDPSNIEAFILETFQNNLTMLNTHFPEVYKKVSLLNEAINQQSFKETFALEYNEKQNEFDLINLNSNDSLYKKSPKSFNKKLISQLKFDTNHSINALPSYIYMKNTENLQFTNFDNFEQTTYTQVFKDLEELKNIFSTNIYNQNIKLQQINKFIFFGTLLGTHIPTILKKLQPNVTLIIEPNLEIFRLSLFITPYYNLINQSQLFFSIMEDENKFDSTFNQFYHTMYFNNNYIKFISASNTTNSYIEKAVSKVARLNPMTQPYTRYIEFFKRSVNYKTKQHNFLDLYNFKNKLSHLPVLFLAAGPSLSDNINWIKENKNKFIIIAPLSLFELLLEKNIKADIVITADYSSAQMSHFKQTTKQQLFNTIALSTCSINQDIANSFNKSNLFFIESKTSFLEQKPIGGTTVGDFGLYTILNLNFTNIYLLGLDLAYSTDERGYTENYDKGKENIYHAENAAFTKNQSSSLLENYSLDKNHLKIKGNKRSQVYSQAIWYYSVLSCNHFINKYKQTDVTIYNLSDGAYIDKTVSCEIDDIDILKFKTFDKKIFYSLLSNNSYNKLKDNEKEKLIEEKKFVDNVLYILENNFNPSFNNIKEWENDKNNFYNQVFFTEAKKYSSFYTIYLNYLLIIESYLNTQLVINSKLKYKQLNKLNITWKSLLKKQLIDYNNILQLIKVT